MAQSHLEQRLKLILAPAVNRRAPSPTAIVAAVIFAVCIFVPLATIHAQSANSGTLSGTVRDPSGAVIPKAIITATNADGNNVEAAYANAAGQYELKSMPAGHYAIDVKSPGFALFRQTNVPITNGNLTRVDPTMNVGSINETVEVVGPRPAAQTSAAPTNPARIRVGGNVQASKLITKVNPTYPPGAQRNGVTGMVILKAVIGVDGHLLSLTPASSAADPELTSAAVEAVRLWTYQPTLLNGQPVEVVTTITVNFRLE
ncbi:MAG: TonB family protein [Acidobacteriaceae bacterium]|nr:TonB family protein [Acidobacteriaceae bacterium]